MPKIQKRRGGRRPRGISPQTLSIDLSDDAGLALYVQIREQIRKLIAQGILAGGMRLPPVRALAAQLQANHLTVAKAYRELVEEGLIEGRRGGGSFVRGPALPATPAQGIESDPTQPMLGELLYELARAPGVIAFASNYPQQDKASVAAFRESLETAVRERLEDCLHYEPPAGRIELRQQIATFVAERGIVADAGEVIITSGAQQGIDLTVRALCPAGTPVAIERPAYYGAINALRGARAKIIEVPLTAEGMDLDILERHLARDRVRLIYTNPTFQNPTGVTMPLDKRRALLAMARRYGAIILEDDHSPELRFRGAPVPAIRSLAESDDQVVYARGFGKVFLPGVRLGFLIAPHALRQRIMFAKATADMHCNGLLQEAVAEYLRRGRHLVTLERMRKTYASRQRILQRAIAAGLPAGAQINNPDGGLSLWLTLPKKADVSELYFRAVNRGVAFVDGHVFHASRPTEHAIRVSFGLNKSEELLEGVSRLCAVVNDLMVSRRERNLVLS